MLPRPNRLHRPFDFRRVYEEGRPFSSASLFLRVRRSRSGRPTRVGVVVSKKISKKATERNRLRRQLRAMSRKIVLAQPQALDIIVVPRAAARLRTYQELVGEYEALIRRIQTTTPKPPRT